MLVISSIEKHFFRYAGFRSTVSMAQLTKCWKQSSIKKRERKKRDTEMKSMWNHPLYLGPRMSVFRSETARLATSITHKENTTEKRPLLPRLPPSLNWVSETVKNQTRIRQWEGCRRCEIRRFNGHFLALRNKYENEWCLQNSSCGFAIDCHNFKVTVSVVRKFFSKVFQMKSLW